ncbi:MAG: hypothetical protein QOI29_3591, partial [Mycobacterium sp.]|nr:hypothetical protein [Mycobacterium sp.]
RVASKRWPSTVLWEAFCVTVNGWSTPTPRSCVCAVYQRIWLWRW